MGCPLPWPLPGHDEQPPRGGEPAAAFIWWSGARRRQGHGDRAAPQFADLRPRDRARPKGGEALSRVPGHPGCSRRRGAGARRLAGGLRAPDMAPALSYGAMNETRDTLEARKRELFDAIRLLEQDREDGLMDEVAYASSRRRYELEAAEVLERLDHLPHERKERTTGRSTLWIALSALGLVMVALAIFLVSSLQHRTE